MESKCSFCGTSLNEILESGFVGCEQCYQLSELRESVDKIFKGRRHRGRKSRGQYGEF